MIRARMRGEGEAGDAGEVEVAVEIIVIFRMSARARVGFGELSEMVQARDLP